MKIIIFIFEQYAIRIDTMTVLYISLEFEETEQKVLAGIIMQYSQTLIELESDLALIAVVIGECKRYSRSYFLHPSNANVNVKMTDQGSKGIEYCNWCAQS